VSERGQQPDRAKRDERAAKPPSETEAGPRDDDEPASTDAPGPAGNPDVDEEALRHRQQEGG
jgi:hypothetical protein